MKVLHTADIHLRAFGDERWKALSTIIETAAGEGVELLVISGDLFDSAAAADELRPNLRDLFSDNGFPIFILPGNHDRDAYGGGAFFGKDVRIISSAEEVYTHGPVSVQGLPFEKMSEEDVLLKLQEMAGLEIPENGGGASILLFHGELTDTYYSRKDFGGEGDDRYMPVKLASFSGLGYDYILAGHFHTRFDIRTIEGGGYFVYPGSPASISRKETGKRMVNLFETSGPPDPYSLGTRYFEDVVVNLDPMSPAPPLDEVRNALDPVKPPAVPLLTIRGFFNGEKHGITETELEKNLDKLGVDKVMECRDVRNIFEDTLFKKFLQKLEDTGYDEDMKKRLRETALMAAALEMGG